ncbi:hypothetical protein FF38_09666 [Lucilia cuprina]|uniref:Chitin-binding type-2 domain-containing protein n=1 Tax=Lucilia cuprina TaxID=7375 RepID=A0A0L0CT84_LUCCU|nr:hypothetical protein FF38_09666 [Lucilia cuprina]
MYIMIPKLCFVLILLWQCHVIWTARTVVEENINICENVADHIFLQDIENCRKYYVCIDGQPRAQECRSGLYFDASRQACIASQQVCLKCPSRQMLNLPLVKTCNKYISCYYGQATLRKCEGNQQFNVKTGKCDWAKNVDCVENHCSIHPLNSELVYVPSAASCEKYYLCMSGKAKALTCAAGLYFSTKCNCCDKSENVQCLIDDNESTLEKNKEKRFSHNYSKTLHKPTLIGETNTIICPSKGLFVYQYIEDPEKYITCVEGKATLYSCAAGYQFDDKQKRCVNKNIEQDILSNNDHTNGTELVQCPERGATILPHTIESKYILCVNGNATVYDCPDDHYFDAKDSHCHSSWEVERNRQLSRYGAVVDEVAAIVCPKYATFTFPHVEREKFYLCLDGKATVFACAEGQFFDINEHGCVIKPIEEELNTGDELAEIEESDNLMVTTTTKRLAEAAFDLDFSPQSIKCPPTGSTTLPHVLRNQYYLCREGIAAVFICPQGLLYDAKLKTCTEYLANNEIYRPALDNDAANIMCPRFGTFKFPHLNKTLYYLCTDGKTYTLACGPREIFDADINICREDELEDMPWANENATQNVTEMANENATQTVTAVATEIASNVICPKFGTFIYPHSQRNRYYVCIDGNAIGFICAEGQYFDTKTNACQRPSKTEENEDDERPVVLDEPINILCPSVGAMKFAHEEKHKFYLCVNGMGSVLACAKGSFFEADSGACRRTFPLVNNMNETTEENDTLASINATTVKCPLSGTFIYAHAEPNQYYVCLEGKEFVLSCPDGYIFDNTEKNCQTPVQSEKVEIKAPQVLDETVNIMCPASGAHKYAHIEKNKFYLCINGMGSVMACPDDSIFDHETGSCLSMEATIQNSSLELEDKNNTDIEKELLPNKTTSEPMETSNITCPKIGTFLYPHKEKNKYFICLDGSAIEFTCAKGLLFDASKNLCVQDAAVENNEINCPAHGTDMLPHKESNKFYLCINGIAIIQSCAAGDSFDVETKTCRETLTISSTLEETVNGNCPLNGTKKLPHLADSNKFYLCIEGKATIHSCAKGNYFDAETETCHETMTDSTLEIKEDIALTDPVNNICPPLGTALIAHIDSNKFYQCIDGIATLQSCAKGDYFDLETQTCRESTLSNMCPPQGTALIPHTDSNKFYQCIDGNAVLQSCATGDIFDIETQTCRETSNIINPRIKCPEVGTFVYPLPQKNIFHVCSDGKARTVYCGEGDIFDAELNVCREASIVENISISQEIPEKSEEMLANVVKELDITFEEKMQLFILLVAFLIGSSTAYTNDINICQGAVDNLFLPVLNNCSAYYVCMDGTPLVRVCREGFLFDAKTQSCTLPGEAQCIKNCTSSLSSFCYDRTCTKYVLCYANTPVVRECCDGLQYNAETDRCDFPQYVDCVDDMCTIFNDPKNITFLASKAACDKYYVCMDGLTYARNCSKGLQFNPECNCCDFKSRVNCSIPALQRNIIPLSKAPPRAADIKCPQEGVHFYPHAQEDKYYFCLKGRGVIMDCTPGLVFDPNVQECREKKNILKN